MAPPPLDGTPPTDVEHSQNEAARARQDPSHVTLHAMAHSLTLFAVRRVCFLILLTRFISPSESSSSTAPSSAEKTHNGDGNKNLNDNEVNEENY